LKGKGRGCAGGETGALIYLCEKKTRAGYRGEQSRIEKKEVTTTDRAGKGRIVFQLLAAGNDRVIPLSKVSPTKKKSVEYTGRLGGEGSRKNRSGMKEKGGRRYRFAGGKGAYSESQKEGGVIPKEEKRGRGNWVNVKINKT